MTSAAFTEPLDDESAGGDLVAILDRAFLKPAAASLIAKPIINRALEAPFGLGRFFLRVVMAEGIDPNANSALKPNVIRRLD